MKICTYAICSISDMDNYVGDFAIGKILGNKILAYPLIAIQYARDIELCYGIKAETDCGTYLIDIMRPQDFFMSQVEAIYGSIDIAAATQLASYQRGRLARNGMKLAMSA